MTKSIRRVVILALSAGLAVGCNPSTHPPTGALPAGGTTVPAMGPLGPLPPGHARARVGVAGLFTVATATGKRRLAGAGFPRPEAEDLSVRRLRLVAHGPGLAPLHSEEVDLSLGGALAELELTIVVPAGANRVFRLEGLDADGHVLATSAVRTLAAPTWVARTLAAN